MSRNKSLTYFKDDTFLVSFPKSGNTWMRYLLIYCLFHRENSDIAYSEVEKHIPSIYKTHFAEINKQKRPRIVKSHVVDQEYPRIIYLIRDGRDAIVSYYYYLRELKGFEGSFKSFYASPIWKGVGEWSDHVETALRYQQEFPENIWFVKYEDLLSNGEAVLSDCFSFMGKNIDADTLKDAYKKASFDRLRNTQSKHTVMIEDKPIDFFRKGKSGQWREYFDEQTLNKFMTKSRTALQKFGYV